MKKKLVEILIGVLIGVLVLLIGYFVFGIGKATPTFDNKAPVTESIQTVNQTGGTNIINKRNREIPVFGVVDDENTIFTTSEQPLFLNINGLLFKQTGGSMTWTYRSGVITLSVPVGKGGSIFGQN